MQTQQLDCLVVWALGDLIEFQKPAKAMAYIRDYLQEDVAGTI
jgi:hypothetical protein